VWIPDHANKRSGKLVNTDFGGMISLSFRYFYYYGNMKEDEEVCFPGPLGCFELPAQLSTAIQEEDVDEPIVSPDTLLVSLRADDPEGCFLCVLDEIGD
jgi:hypothetical protein